MVFAVKQWASLVPSPPRLMSNRHPPGPLALHPTWQGYDATSHFESEMLDVMDMYRRITGESGAYRLYAGHGTTGACRLLSQGS